MANTKSASKRARQTTRRSLRNRSVLTRLRKLHKNVGSGTAQPDVTAVRDLISAVDKAAKRGIIHKNAARRRKARLLAKARGGASAPAAAAPAPAAAAPAA